MREYKETLENIVKMYEPFRDSFSEEELKFSFEIFNDKKYTSEFFNDYCKELNKLSKTLEKYY